MTRLLVHGGRRLTGVALVFGSTISCADAPAPPEGPLTLDGARLHYEVVGSGDPVIVVHGGPGLDHNYLRPGLDILGGDYEVIYFDQRGTGGSEADLTVESINLDRFVADIDAIREHLGHERITVVAHSFGSLIGTRYAMTFPDRLKALVLVNPVEPGSRFQEATGERVSAMRRPGDADELATLAGTEAFAARDPEAWGEFYRLVFRSTLREPDRVSELDLEMRPLTASQGTDVAQLLGGSMQGLDWWDELGVVSVPTLVVHGRYDLPPEAMGRALADAFPDGRLVVLETGHFPFMESPEEFRSAIVDFLTSVR